MGYRPGAGRRVSCSLWTHPGLRVQRVLDLDRTGPSPEVASDDLDTQLAVQFPLLFASNVFVDPATMPGWLRAFVNVNPVSHLVSAERALMNGTGAAGQAGWVLLASAALVAIFGPVTMLLYRSRQ